MCIRDSDKIDKNKIQILKNPKNKIYIANITFWEISLKYNMGKLKLEGFKPDDLLGLVNKMD